MSSAVGTIVGIETRVLGTAVAAVVVACKRGNKSMFQKGADSS